MPKRRRKPLSLAPKPPQLRQGHWRTYKSGKKVWMPGVLIRPDLMDLDDQMELEERAEASKWPSLVDKLKQDPTLDLNGGDEDDRTRLWDRDAARAAAKTSSRLLERD